MLSVALPYHLKVLDHFKRQSKIWDFFATAGVREEQSDTDPLLYDTISFVKNKLEMEGIPEARLILSRDLTDGLPESEWLGVIARELARIKLYTLLQGELEVTDRIMTAIATNTNDVSFRQSFNDEPSARAPVSPYGETARRFRLCTEIYCDRGVLSVLGEIPPIPGPLSEDPEKAIRTRALGLWFEKQAAAEPEIARMIEGTPELDRLDIFAQQELADLTREFLLYYLRPEWFQSAPVISLAREYFPDLLGVDLLGVDLSGEDLSGEQHLPAAKQRPDRRDTQGRLFGASPAGMSPEQIATKIAVAHSGVKEYFAWLLLDFARADPSLKESSSGHALQLAEEMQLSAFFEDAAKKESPKPGSEQGPAKINGN